MVDDEYEPPMKELPQWRLRVEFWVEGIGDDYGTDTTEAGSYLYLATDQVRFYRVDAALKQRSWQVAAAIACTDQRTTLILRFRSATLNPLALSEVFRDVDLFVGVASVGNDPNWSDGGPEGRFFDYWNSYSFGELNESANTRKTILEGPDTEVEDTRSMRGHGSFPARKGRRENIQNPSGLRQCTDGAQ